MHVTLKLLILIATKLFDEGKKLLHIRVLGGECQRVRLELIWISKRLGNIQQVLDQPLRLEFLNRHAWNNH